jgi:plastocyanin
MKISTTALAAALCACVANAATLEVRVRDAAGAPVPDAAVYAVPSSGPVDARNAKAVAIEQVDREFIPYMTVVQTGTPVSFPNRDPIQHHVYSFSPAKPFEIKLYSGNSPEILLDRPGMVTLGCNIHDWMIGYVLVVPTPHFGRTDAAGIARLRELPGGSYEVRAVHPNQRAAAAPQSLALEASAAAAAGFVVDVALRKPRYKPPLDRSRY